MSRPPTAAPESRLDVAPVWRRWCAAVLDAAVPALTVIAGGELLWTTGLLRLGGVSDDAWVTWSWSFQRVAWTVAAAALVYHAVCIARWQATPGKRLLGLRVVTQDGGRPGGWVAVWRATWQAAVFVPTFISPLVLLASWAMVPDSRHRSLGDHAAGTLVLRSAPPE